MRESNAIRCNDWRQEKGRLMGVTIASCEASGEALRWVGSRTYARQNPSMHAAVCSIVRLND